MPGIITSRTKRLYLRPPHGPFVLNRDCPYARGLEAWFPLGEGNSETFADRAGRVQRVLTRAGTISITAGPDGGYAASPGGVATNKLTMATSPVTTTPYHLGCWAYPNNVTTYYSLIGVLQNITNEAYGVLGIAGATAGDPVIMESAHAGATYANSATSRGYVAGRWQRFDGNVVSATSRSSWIDGAGKGTNTTSVTVGTFDSFRVGGYSDVDGDFDGLNGNICEVGVWSVVRTDAEVWRTFDPATRWEHRYVIGRKMWSFPTGGAVADQPYFYGSNEPLSSIWHLDKLC